MFFVDDFLKINSSRKQKNVTKTVNSDNIISCTALSLQIRTQRWQDHGTDEVRRPVRQAAGRDKLVRGARDQHEQQQQTRVFGQRRIRVRVVRTENGPGQFYWQSEWVRKKKKRNCRLTAKIRSNRGKRRFIRKIRLGFFFFFIFYRTGTFHRRVRLVKLGRRDTERPRSPVSEIRQTVWHPRAVVRPRRTVRGHGTGRRHERQHENHCPTVVRQSIREFIRRSKNAKRSIRHHLSRFYGQYNRNTTTLSTHSSSAAHGTVRTVP